MKIITALPLKALSIAIVSIMLSACGGDDDSTPPAVQPPVDSVEPPTVKPPATSIPATPIGPSKP
ncbi:MAG: hypothetical protein ACTHWC_09255, partial [Psychrobacter sp.]